MLVGQICYYFARHFGVAPAVVQITLLVLAYAGWLVFSPVSDRISNIMWLALAVIVVFASRLFDKDWFKTPGRP